MDINNMNSNKPSAQPRPVPRPGEVTTPPMPSGVPTPAPAPAPAPVNPTPMQNTAAPVRMSQGANYAGESTPTPTGNTVPDFGGDAGDNKPKLNIKIIGIGIGVGLILIILIALFGKLDGLGSGEETPDEPIQTEEPLVALTPPPQTNYDYADVATLRACGFSTDEMETAYSLGIPVADLVKQAEEERQAWIDEAVLPLFDTTSDEYKEDMKQTWRGLTKREGLTDYAGQATTYTITRNLDYEKIDVMGDQLFIKIYTDMEGHAEYFFHQCTLNDWLALKDQGNVIVTYTYETPMKATDYGYEEVPTQIFIMESSIQIFN